MRADRSQLSIEIAGHVFERWSSYHLSSDVMIPADQFSAALALQGTADERKRILELVDKGISEVRAYVYLSDQEGARRVLQYTGLLDTRSIKGEKTNGTGLQIECRDAAAHLVQSSCDLEAVANTGTNFLSLIRRLVSPWHIEVVADGAASRDVSTGLSLSLPPNVNRTTRANYEQGNAPNDNPNQPTVFTDDEEALAAERAAGAARRRALASVRTLGAAAIAGDTPEQRRATNQEQAQIFAARDRAAAYQRIAQRRAAETVSANGQTATAIRTISLREARPQPGETIWDFILRHARRFGLLPWFSPEGKLIIAAPNYGAAPTHRIVRRIRSRPDDPNNVVGGGDTFNVGDRYSKITVYGRGLGRDSTRAPIVGVATDETMPFFRPKIVQDMSIRDTDEANRRAQREMMRAQHARRELTYQVSGHGNGRALYAVDTIVHVLDEVAGIDGEFYVISRTFSADRSNGKATVLKLCEKGSILL